MDLYDLGFRPIGSGLFGTVYIHPLVKDRVFKVGIRGDQWFRYIEWATLSGWAGSFAPKVYRVHKGRNFDGYIAEMELLSAHHRDDFYFRFVDRLANYKFSFRNDPRDAGPGAECFLKQFHYRFKEYFNDIGYSNVLARKVGDTYLPVLTDPFADSNPIPYSFNAMRTIKTAAYLPPSLPYRSLSHA